MVMMMVVVSPVGSECAEGRPDHEAVVMMMVVVVMIVLRQLGLALLRRPALLFIHRLQQRDRVRDWLQQLRIGVCS